MKKKRKRTEKQSNAPTTEELMELALARRPRQKRVPVVPADCTGFWIGPVRLEFSGWRLAFMGLNGHFGWSLTTP
jgi:hypothetical protein